MWVDLHLIPTPVNPPFLCVVLLFIQPIKVLTHCMHLLLQECQYMTVYTWNYTINKANQITLLVSHPPYFIVLCGRAVIIHYSLFNKVPF